MLFGNDEKATNLTEVAKTLGVYGKDIKQDVAPAGKAIQAEDSDDEKQEKKRELFRPFAPVVLEEYASKWFDMKFTSPYMQYAVKCLKPELIPSVVHKDGTSRVQTVNKEQHPGLHEVLSNWYSLTGIPILLNTSLNVKSQPLLNDKKDILEWESIYGVKIIV